MFTGIITGVGQIVDSQALGADASHGRRLTLQTPAGYLDGVGLGDSIAINGACMTVTSFDVAAGRFTIDVSAESLARTVGLDQLGTVNMEQALRSHDRLGGHIVTGHVDGVGQVVSREEVGGSTRFWIATPADLAPYVATKGSITVDGVSLTVNEIADQADGTCHFMLNIIPHTAEVTTIGALQVGDTVNLEIDVLARYLQRMQSLRS